MVGEPCFHNIRNMDGTTKTNLDGNHMTTMAVSGSLTKGCDLETRDGLTSSSSSSLLSSLPSSSSSSSLLMAPSGTKKKEIKDGRETLRGEDFRKEGRNGRREGMIKETEEKENLEVVTERKKTGRPMDVVDYFLEDLSSPVLGGIIMDWASWVDMICRKLGNPVNEELLLCASTMREGTLELMTRLQEKERKELERKELERLRRETEKKDMEERELERKEMKRKVLKKEMIMKELVNQLQEAKDEISRLEGVIKGRELKRKETVRKELEKMEGTETIRKELVTQLREAKNEISRLEGVIKGRELERKETERKELEKMEGTETIRKELVSQLREAKDEISRLEGVIKGRELERKETERKELEKMEGKEMIRKELEIQLREAKDEISRLEGVIKGRELERKEMERKELEMMEGKEMTRKELVSQIREAKDEISRLEGVIMEKKELERKELERKELERKELERKEFKRKEMERKETERKKMERRKVERKETERKETGRKELEKKKTERKEIEGKELEREKAGPVMVERSNVTSISPFLIGEDCSLPPLPQRVTRNFTARSGGDSMPPVVQSPPPMVNRGFEGVKTDGGACKDVTLEDGSMSGSETEWRLVGGRRRGRDPLPPPPLSDSGMEPSGPSDCTERRSLPRQQIKIRPRPSLSSAVMITGRAVGFSYAAALRSAREKIDLEALGIGTTCVRRAANGGVLIEVPGVDSRVKAEELGMKIRDVLKDSATVSCPRKKCDLRITGFDESVLPDEISRVVSSFGGCSIEDLRVGPIRTFNNGLGIVVVQLPVVAARKLVDIDCIRLGWTMARAEVLETRPLQCYRCWMYGHVQNTCKSTIDRRDMCFKCGQLGHQVSKCQNMAHCVACFDKGLKATHRFGGPCCEAQVQHSTTLGSRRLLRTN